MRSLADQHQFNLRRWAELVANPKLADLPNKIEADRDGDIIMSPPADRDHGDRQIEIGHQLKGSVPKGAVISECAVSTSEGTKVPDVAWLSEEHPQVLERKVLVAVPAPDICIEILSPSNTVQEIARKKALYFEAGAKEVWICDAEGSLEFCSSSAVLAASNIFPQFPKRIYTYGEQAAMEMKREKAAAERSRGMRHLLLVEQAFAIRGTRIVKKTAP
jgi:Uma2 family endonuclease